MDRRGHYTSGTGHRSTAPRHRKWKAGQANLRDWTEQALQIDERLRRSLRDAPAANDWSFDSEGQKVCGSKQGGGLDE